VYFKYGTAGTVLNTHWTLNWLTLDQLANEEGKGIVLMIFTIAS